MIYLASTSDKLQVVTSSANAIHVHATYIDLSGTTVTPERADTSITAATTTDVVASPSASTTRKIKFLSVFNDHATAAQDIVIRHTDGTTAVDLWAGSVRAQTGVTFDEKSGWRVSSPFPSADIQTFDTPGGIWTKPTEQKTGLTLIRLWGGGGGGGGGASLITASKGGAGGGGAGCISQLFLTAALPDTLRVIIGEGGAGGAGGLAGAVGTAGVAGSDSLVLSASQTLLTSFGGAGGSGGAITAAATTGASGTGSHNAAGATSNAAAGTQPCLGVSGATPNGPTWEAGSSGGGSGTTGIAGAGGNARFGGGGGGAGGSRTAVAATSPSAGGGTGNNVGATAGGLGGAAGTSGSSPTNGANGTDGDGFVGGTGGGGGGSTIDASVAGANGGNGGKFGGGGGGGGVGSNPALGGNGGNGGNGFGWIATW